MNKFETSTTLRIPGKWTHPRELIERIPAGFRVTPEAVILPDGTNIALAVFPPDDQFVGIFNTACRQPLTDDEAKTMNGYTVKIGLHGPGGSMPAALTMLRAAAALVRAGGAGVFIDNSGLAHGGSHWIEMAEDGSPDAVSFAFAAVIRSRQEVWTVGMHVMGLKDLVIPRSENLDADADRIVEVIRHLCCSREPIGDGHLLPDLGGSCFQLVATSHDRFDTKHPMHNPFGRLKLTRM